MDIMITIYKVQIVSFKLIQLWGYRGCAATRLEITIVKKIIESNMRQLHKLSKPQNYEGTPTWVPNNHKIKFDGVGGWLFLLPDTFGPGVPGLKPGMATLKYEDLKFVNSKS